MVRWPATAALPAWPGSGVPGKWPGPSDRYLRSTPSTITKLEPIRGMSMVPIGSPGLGTGIDPSAAGWGAVVGRVVGAWSRTLADWAAWSWANCLRRLSWASEVWMPVPHSW